MVRIDRVNGSENYQDKPLTNLRILKNEPDASLIDLLERLLDKAKKGEIIGMSGVSINRMGVIAEFYTESCIDTPGLYATIGAIEALKHDLLFRFNDQH